MSLYINNQIVLCCKDSANLGNTKGKRKKKKCPASSRRRAFLRFYNYRMELPIRIFLLGFRLIYLVVNQGYARS